MLKIKDDIDLKELEKFGFTKKYSTYRKLCDGKYCAAWVSVDGHKHATREIYCELWEANESVLETIYDLIQAGLVEKVKGEN